MAIKLKAHIEQIIMLTLAPIGATVFFTEYNNEPPQKARTHKISVQITRYQKPVSSALSGRMTKAIAKTAKHTTAFGTIRDSIFFFSIRFPYKLDSISCFFVSKSLDDISPISSSCFSFCNFAMGSSADGCGAGFCGGLGFIAFPTC